MRGWWGCNGVCLSAYWPCELCERSHCPGVQAHLEAVIACDLVDGAEFASSKHTALRLWNERVAVDSALEQAVGGLCTARLVWVLHVSEQMKSCGMRTRR